MNSRTDRARFLRKVSPSAERLVWSRLRDRRLGGFKFNRQFAIGPFFVDFVCRDRALVIEIDGATHSTEEELWRDARRSEELTHLGYAVMRFTNDAIFTNLDGVMETILARLEGRETI